MCGQLLGVRQRRSRHVERRELLEEGRDATRVGTFVHPVEGRHAAPLADLGNPLVGEDHQLLDQAVGLGLGDRVSPDHVPVGIELELRLGGRDLQRAPARVCRAAPPQRRGRSPVASRSPPARLLAGEDAVELVVVEPAVGANAAAVEARRARLAGGREDDLGGHREALDAGGEAAGHGRERQRQHRLDGSRDVGAVAAPQRLAIERGTGSHVCRDVGDVDPEPRPVRVDRGRDRVVEVAGAGRIDGERGQVT